MLWKPQPGTTARMGKNPWIVTNNTYQTWAQGFVPTAQAMH